MASSWSWHVLALAAAFNYRFRMSPTAGWFARDLTSMALALPVVLLWIRVIVPVLVRPFGIPIPTSFIGRGEWREAIQRLPTLTNMLVLGVLMVGIGMILATLVRSFVEWRLFGQPWHFMSVRDLVYGTILWAIISVLVLLSKIDTKTPE
jgi:hypothetical protein